METTISFWDYMEASAADCFGISWDLLEAAGVVPIFDFLWQLQSRRVHRVFGPPQGPKYKTFPKYCSRV